MVQGRGSNGIFWRNDKEGGGFSASEEFRNSLAGSVDSNRDVVCGFKRSDAGSKRIKLTESNRQEEEASTSKESSPLGLTLSKTPSFVNMLEMMLSQGRKTNSLAKTNRSSDHGGVQAKVDDIVSQQMAEKLKASNFPASLLRIGSWEKETRYEGDLVAKCYYAKRKLVWEVLEIGLKKKIELQWSDILAIKATIQENEPGILEIELNQPPSFFQETNPQPRKHTLWQLTSDFTGGQAPTFRRHYLIFPPGALDKHYEKLLQCDDRLFKLSQRPFPSLESPYFRSNLYGFSKFSCNSNTSVAEIPQVLQFPSHQFQSFEQTTKPSHSTKDSTSPDSVMDFSTGDENVSNNNGFDNPRMAVWGQDVSNNIIGRGDQIQAPAFSTYGEEEERSKQNTQTAINNIEQILLGDSSQGFFSDEKEILARVKSMSSLLEETEQVSPVNVTGTRHMDSRQDRDPGDHLVLSTACPQPVLWVPSPQVCNDNLLMHLSKNNSLYPYEFSAPTMEDFETFDRMGDYGYGCK